MSNKKQKKDEKVEKLIFKDISLDIDTRVKKISDPPPRPQPQRLDIRDVREWQPKTKSIDSRKLTESVSTIGNVLKWTIFTTISIGILVALGYAVYWVFGQYNL